MEYDCCSELKKLIMNVSCIMKCLKDNVKCKVNCNSINNMCDSELAKSV